MFYLMNSADMK